MTPIRRRTTLWTLAILLVLSAQVRTQVSPPTPSTTPALPEPVESTSSYDSQGPSRFTQSALRIGQDYRLQANAAAREVTVILGNAQIDGRVDEEVVVIMGSAHLGSNASIGDSLVVIGGTITVAPGADVRRDIVSIGGGIDAPGDFRPGGEFVVIGPNLVGGRLEGLTPWISRGLLWGRPIVPNLPWVWGIVGIFFLLYLSINLVFHEVVRTCAETLAARPLTSFLVGLLVLLLLGPVCVLLAVSLIGLAIIPIVVCAVFVAGLLGRVCVMRWLGMRVVSEETPGNQLQSTRSFVIGFAILCVPYMIPIIGFVMVALVGVLGLGAAALSFIAGYRRENPLPPTPPSAPSSPLSGPPPFDPPGPSVDVMTPGLAYAESAPLPAAAPTMAADDMRLPLPPTPDRLAFSSPSAAGPRLAALPHAAFIDRLSAIILDFILCIIIWRTLPIVRHADGSGLFATMLAYHIGFWTWKGTTVGGIICQLRLVRIDGQVLSFADALVRGLSAIFSIAVLGLGELAILRDPDRQAWHDKIAGTYVVKVPRHWPI